MLKTTTFNGFNISDPEWINLFVKNDDYPEEMKMIQIERALFNEDIEHELLSIWDLDSIKR